MTPGRQLYDLYGLRIASDIPLHVPARPGVCPDLEVTLKETRSVPAAAPSGELIAIASLPNGRGAAVSEQEGRHLLRFYGTCDFEISQKLDRMSVFPDPSCDEALLPLFIKGSAISVYLRLAGEPVLHASAVGFSGGVVAFAGAGGQGKSTLAATLCHEGGVLVTDDVLRLELGKAEVRCFYGPPDLRLRGSSTCLAEGFELKPHKTADDRTAVTLLGGTKEDRLKAVIVPSPSRSAAELSWHRLTRTEALMQLSIFSSSYSWKQPALRESQFRQVAEVIRRVPVYRAEIPWRVPFSRPVIDDLLALTREALQLKQVS